MHFPQHKKQEEEEEEEEVNFSHHMIQLKESRVGGGEGHTGAGRDECIKTSTAAERECLVGSICFTAAKAHYS